jgi:transcriptional regulator with PAS, ATPase and Fis domain
MELYRYLFSNRVKIQELCNTFTAVTGISIALVDKKLIRIAATGPCNVNQFLNINGLVQKRVIELDQDIIVDHPTEDVICHPCIQKEFCKESFELCMPIHLSGEVVGSISFITFKLKDKKFIKDNYAIITQFAQNFINVIEQYLNNRKEVIHLKSKGALESHRSVFTFDELIGSSKNFVAVIEKAKMVAPNDVTVMISGESGTGKELLAQAIHSSSPRRQKSFVAINCGAIPDNLIESELFGYTGGAFTGANQQGRLGKFEVANGGTLFLDEVTEMPISLQTKLLRVLQEQKLERLGSNKSISLDVRIISATNKDIQKLIEKGLFREDLYYRLNVIPLELPPLRNRSDDIVALMNHFMTKHSEFITNRFSGEIKVEKRVFEYLKRYSWPGNIRELENVVMHMLNLIDGDGNVTLESLPVYMRGDNIHNPNVGFVTIEDMEIAAILNALEFYGEDTEGKQAAADSLGISLTTLYRKLKKYNICLT